MGRTLQAIQLRLINWWPPFLAAGIKAHFKDSSFREITVYLKLRFYNRNYVGTHYGGSLYSMTDPFYMLMLMHNLGRDYIVWDKGAEIEFKRPGTGKVSAQFKLDEEKISAIKAELLTKEKCYPEFKVEVVNEKGEVVTVVKKILYVAKKKAKV